MGDIWLVDDTICMCKYNVCLLQDSDKPDIHGSIKKMFIGAMKEGTTEEMIRELFSEFGEVAKVEMVMDKATGKPKSFCFVEFEDYDAVDKCVCK